MRKQKTIILAYLITSALVIFSSFWYYKNYYIGMYNYNKINKNCFIEKKLDLEICKNFINEDRELDSKLVNRYKKESNPIKTLQKTDVITASSTIIEISSFRYMQFLSPLIIIVVTVLTFHSEISSGFFENILMREEYKKYLKTKLKDIISIALLMPYSILLVFIIACFITNFNFDASSVYKYSAVYDYWKYNNFFFYEIIIMSIQFFISLAYINISFESILKNKNKLISIVVGYIGFIILDIIIYVVIYAIIINKILGYKELSDIFNIAGYWFFDNGPKWILALPISAVVALFSAIYLFSKYKNKEGIISLYETKHI